MNETQTFLTVMGTIITILGWVSWKLTFGKNGVYNKEDMPSLDTEPEDLPYIPASPPPVMAPDAPKQPPAEPSAPERVYSVAKANLGQKLTLNPSVPPEVGCAQALSKILVLADYPIPTGGISTVAGLTKWMLKEGFVEEKKYGIGYVITGRNSTTAHIGICGNDWIMSNTSYTDTKKDLTAGAFQANYRKESWKKVYPQTRYFRPV